MELKCFYPMGRKFKTISIIIALLLVLPTACVTAPSSTTALPTVTVPTPASLIDYDAGTLEVPPGQFLFIEYSQSSTCSSECNCPVVEPPRSLYEFTGEGWLWMDPGAFGGPQALTKLMDAGLPGFYGYGQWREGIYPITGLPYSAPPYEVMHIDSIRSDGSVVVGIHEQILVLKSGETWSNSSLSMWESPPGCMKQYDSRLANHGFLTWEQVHACPDRYNCE